MDEQISKKEMLDLIRSEWKALWSVLKPLSREQMIQPGVESSWSVKDILAHITAWERRMVQWLEESLRGEVPERPAPGMSWDDLDGLNEQIYRENKDRPLDGVLADSRKSHEESLKVVEAMAEEDLIEPDRFGWRGGDPMWHMVAANTWWHYKEHCETITSWLVDAP
jgi:hypothetical protein